MSDQTRETQGNDADWRGRMSGRMIPAADAAAMIDAEIQRLLAARAWLLERAAARLPAHVFADVRDLLVEPFDEGIARFTELRGQYGGTT